MENSTIGWDAQCEWYAIRDALLGQNGRVQNLALAVSLANTCNHPKAAWLSTLFAEQEDFSREAVGKCLFEAAERGDSTAGLKEDARVCIHSSLSFYCSHFRTFCLLVFSSAQCEANHEGSRGRRR